jgi:hypothetical protein
MAGEHLKPSRGKHDRRIALMGRQHVLNLPAEKSGKALRNGATRDAAALALVFLACGKAAPHNLSNI